MVDVDKAERLLTEIAGRLGDSQRPDKARFDGTLERLRRPGAECSPKLLEDYMYLVLHVPQGAELRKLLGDNFLPVFNAAMSRIKKECE